MKTLEWVEVTIQYAGGHQVGGRPRRAVFDGASITVLKWSPIISGLAIPEGGSRVSRVWLPDTSLHEFIKTLEHLWGYYKDGQQNGENWRKVARRWVTSPRWAENERGFR